KHITSARFFSLLEGTSPSAKIPFPLPTSDAFQEYARKLGIRHDSHVIVYDQAIIPGIFACRLWWNLRAFGHSRVSILDGNLPYFEKLPDAMISSEGNPECQTGDFTVDVNQSLIRDYERMNSVVDAASTQILDTRLSVNFTAEEAEPSEGNKKAMIQASSKARKSFLTVKTKYLNKFKIQKLQIPVLSEVDLQMPITVTCYLGYTACMLAAALHHCGHEDAAVYCGSWTEWSQRKAEEGA
ncbi:hypothetical protein CAPTEDRAFT_115676, partial [Capitella teleta]